MAMKVQFQVMVFTLVFIMLTTQLVWGEEDCYDQKKAVKLRCMKTIKLDGDYVDPSDKCRETVQKSDMACVCRVISPHEQLRISVVKLVRLARACGKIVPAGSKCGSKCHILLILYATNFLYISCIYKLVRTYKGCIIILFFLD